MLLSEMGVWRGGGDCWRGTCWRGICWRRICWGVVGFLSGGGVLFLGGGLTEGGGGVFRQMEEGCERRGGGCYFVKGLTG